MVLLIGIALIALLWLAYVHPRSLSKAPRPATPYYVTQVFMLGLFVPLCVAGMRGGFTTAVRPITLSNANQFVNRPAEAALVLNTPFSMIRTATKKAFVDPKYYTPDELNAIYSPLHRPGDALTPPTQERGGDYSRKLRTRICGRPQSATRRRALQGRDPLPRFAHRGEHDLRKLVCQRTQEHRRHALGVVVDTPCLSNRFSSLPLRSTT